jgi:hypothetical protein
MLCNISNMKTSVGVLGDGAGARDGEAGLAGDPGKSERANGGTAGAVGTAGDGNGPTNGFAERNADLFVLFALPPFVLSVGVEVLRFFITFTNESINNILL